MTHIRHEEEIEDDVSNRQGLLRNIRIAPEEYKKFGLFGGMFFLIGFIYSFMRILKDMFVMSRQDASCFNFIKIFYILPLSFIVILLINYLLQRRSVAKIFNLCLVIFMALFVFFGVFVVFEKQLMFDPEPLKDKYENSNKLLRDFIYTVAEPIATLIFVTAELWGSIILSYLFLSYLNESCSERQHRRFIPPLFIITNISLLVSAVVTTGMRSLKQKMNEDQLRVFMGGIFFVEGGLAFIIFFLKYYLEKNIMGTPIFIPKQKKQRAKKPKVSFKESIKTMFRSRFLLAMCGVVFFYNCLYNLIETVYKFGIKASAEFNEVPKADLSAKFNNYDQYITSIAVILLNLTPFSYLADTKGWTFVAMITPVVSAVALFCVFGLGAYNSALENETFGFINKIVKEGSPFFFFENFMGMLILSSMKIFKYTAFDVTKERISMRIEDRYRPKFKSIYDGIFNKLGKSAGSAYGVFINVIFSTLDPRGASPITGLISALFVFFWISGVHYLGNNYEESMKTDSNINIDLRGEKTEEMEEIVEEQDAKQAKEAIPAE